MRLDKTSMRLDRSSLAPRADRLVSLGNHIIGMTVSTKRIIC